VSISISDASGDVMLKSGTDPCDGSSKIDASYKPKLTHVFSNVRLRGPSSVMSMGACVPLWYAAMSAIEPTLLTGLREFLHLRPHLPTLCNTQTFTIPSSPTTNTQHTRERTWSAAPNAPAAQCCPLTHVRRTFDMLCGSREQNHRTRKGTCGEPLRPPTRKIKARHAPTTDDLLPSCRGTCCARQCGSAR